MLALPKPDAEADRPPRRTPTARPRDASRQATPSRPPTTAAAGRRGDAATAEPLVKERLFAQPDAPERARPPAAPSRSSCAPAGSTARSRRPARSASRATRSSSSSSRPARRSPPAPCSAASARVLGQAPVTCASRSARPAAAPRAIDPKPILDGWKLLESTAIYRAKGKNPFVGPDAATPTIGQILLMSKETLPQRVLADPRDPDLRLRPPGHPGRRDRPPRAGDARVPRRLGLQPDDHVARSAATPT